MDMDILNINKKWADFKRYSFVSACTPDSIAFKKGKKHMHFAYVQICWINFFTNSSTVTGLQFYVSIKLVD
ncbi:hypothetical protein COE25_28640 [Bacillus sp. AFS031507]|nr:hypothetical protein COE25_28640 [Bacillus sp. AFS031507]